MKVHLKHKKLPIAVSLRWISEMTSLKGSGVYEGPRDTKKFRIKKDIEHHSMLVVGYGTQVVGRRPVEYWLLKNSHGNDWGDNGYYKFSMKIKDAHGCLFIQEGLIPKGIIVENFLNILLDTCIQPPF
jgi:hypothetical protein